MRSATRRPSSTSTSRTVPSASASSWRRSRRASATRTGCSTRPGRTRRPWSARSRRSRCARTWRSCARRTGYEGTRSLVRCRILAIAAAVVTAVIIAFAVPALRGGGGENSLARAAENLQGQNMRIDFVAGGAQGKEDSAVSAAGVVSADGSRGRLTMHVEVQGTKVTVRQLRVGGQVYVASSQLDKALPPGKRWVHATSAADTPTTMSMPEFANFLKGAGVGRLDPDAGLDRRPRAPAAPHHHGRRRSERLGDAVDGHP